MKKKKVFIVIPTLGTGGGEKLVVDLATNINKDKFEVNIICLFSKKNTIYESMVKDSKIKVIYMDKKLGPDLRLMINVVKLFKKCKPDIVHTHLNVLPYILPAILISKPQSRLHTIHSVAQEDAKGISRILMKFAFKFFHVKPIAICDYVQATIQDVYKLKKVQIPCIYNAVDTSKFKRNRVKTNGTINFISTGTLYHVKNHKLIIDAFFEVEKKFSNISLTILGDGELRQELQMQINNYGLEEKINLKGIVRNVANELNSSDIYIMASNYEGLPLSILEAMSCGLPIISTKAGGVVDIVKHGTNGILVDVNNKEQMINAMIKLCTDQQMQLKMGENSYEMSKLYDIKRCAENYEILYNTLS